MHWIKKLLILASVDSAVSLLIANFVWDYRIFGVISTVYTLSALIFWILYFRFIRKSPR